MRGSFFASVLLAGSAISMLAPGQAPPPRSEIQQAAEEFRVLTQALGLRPGGPRRAQAAGGARARYHGRVFLNMRNEFLDAIPKEQRQRNIFRRNLLRRQQFGFNVSGPLAIPKLLAPRRTTFFSVNYEGVREKIGRSFMRTIPIVEQWDGDYRRVVDAAGHLLHIFDPATTRANPDYDPSRPVSMANLQFIRDPFPGSIIPAFRHCPVALRTRRYYPLPNADAGPFFRNNLFVVSPETNRADGMIFKVDHAFLDKHRLSGNLSFTDGLAASARFLPNIADSAPADRQHENRRLSLEHIFTLSPQSVNTATAEVFSDVNQFVTEGARVPESLGIPGVDGDPFPRMDIGFYVGMGRVNPVARSARTTWVYTNSFAQKRGKHNVRLVSQFVRQQVNTFVPRFPSGYFRFQRELTSLPGIVNTGDAHASFLLGLADHAELSLIPSPNYYRASRGAFAVHDTWEPRPGLVFNFSGRFEIGAPRMEQFDSLSTIDLRAPNSYRERPGALVAAARNGEPRMLQPWMRFLDPSASLAWNPGGNRKALLRAGYARSNERIPIFNGHWGTQGFNAYATFFSPNVQLTPAAEMRRGLPPLQYPLPDLRAEAANFTVADLVDRSGTLPVHQSSWISYERELPGLLVLTASAGTAWGRNAFVGNFAINPNAIHPDLLGYRDSLNDEMFRRGLRPYPQFLGFDVFSSWPGGRYRRNAMTFRAEKRSSQGLAMNATYEYSRQWDDFSGPHGKQDFFNSRNEWSLSAFNNPHRLSFNFMYELPIGSGKPFLNFTDWRRFIASGWAVSGISSVASGEPLALRAQFNNTGTVLQMVRVNTVPGIDPRVENPGADLWFNPAAFSHPADFSIGDGPRTHPFLRNPVNQNHDLSISKRIAIDAEKSVEFNASGFNFINNANWNDPDIMIGPAWAPNVNSGRIIGSRGGRVIQMGLRFSF
jgi:hypothetical protein